MSRIGKEPIKIPTGVDVKLNGSELTVKGPKGSLESMFHKDMIIKIEDNIVVVQRPTETKIHKSLHGLTRTLIYNMVVGVTEGFVKTLEIQGVGYRAQKQGNKLILTLGYSHPIEMIEPEGITYEVPAPNRIIVRGIDKQAVGQWAAKIRGTRLPEPYKGKGVRYEGEVVRLKVGKTGAKAK